MAFVIDAVAGKGRRSPPRTAGSGIAARLC